MPGNPKYIIRYATLRPIDIFYHFPRSLNRDQGCSFSGSYEWRHTIILTDSVMNRRQFFGRFNSQERVVRPPGAQSDKNFIQNCDGCGACVDACPQGIIEKVEANRPVVNFARAGCTFCGQCIDVCKRDALINLPELRRSWRWRAEVSISCLDKKGIVCRACEAACEHDAIRFRPLLGGRTDVSVRLEDCDGCGVCIAACPSSAIKMFKPAIPAATLKEEAA